MILRMALAMLLSLGISLAAGPGLIRWLKKLHFGTVIYELGPAHQQKQDHQTCAAAQHHREPQADVAGVAGLGDIGQRNILIGNDDIEFIP